MANISFFSILGAEFRRTLRLARSYWLEYVSDFLLYTVGFLLLILVFQASSESYGPRGILSTLIGYITWKVGASLMVDIAKIAAEESRTGTLEQMFLTRQGVGRVFFNRTTGIMLNHGIRGLVLGTAIAAILNILQPISTLGLVVFLLTIVGASGLGFALAGLVLVYKRLEGFLHLLWQMLVFFTGALAPIYHPILGTLAKGLPLTWGIEALRAVFLDELGWVSLWQSGVLTGLIVNTIFYAGLGIVLFTWGQKRARILGVLAHY